MSKDVMSEPNDWWSRNRKFDERAIRVGWISISFALVVWLGSCVRAVITGEIGPEAVEQRVKLRHVQEKVVARKFELVDSQGNVRATLTMRDDARPVLLLSSETGVKITCDDSDSGRVVLCDSLTGENVEIVPEVSAVEPHDLDNSLD